MYGTLDDWRAARAALVDELTRLRHQFDGGAPLARHDATDLRPTAMLAPTPALVPAQGFHRPGGRPTMLALCN